MTASTRLEKAPRKVRTPEPLPADPNGQRLCTIFGRYLWNCIQADWPIAATAQLNWQTITGYQMRPRVLWMLWQNPNTLIGVRFTHDTTYALLDIDAGSDYCTVEGIAQLRAALETIGITRTLLIRSSWSGGLHLYIPLPEAIGTFDLAVTLKGCLLAQKFRLQAGQLEIFPNVKAYGVKTFVDYNAHRLPLQPDSGSCLLDDDLNPIGHSLEQFFELWERQAQHQDLQALHQACKLGRDNHRNQPRRRHHPAEAWRQDLETEMADGWTGPGQTNQLLKTIACYGRVFERLQGQDLVDYVLQKATQCPGYRQHCGHQHEIQRRARAWAQAAENYYWPLGTTPPPRTSQNNLVLFNRQQADAAQQRIRAAYASLQQAGLLPDQITARVRALAHTAGVSQQTLYKTQNLSLWHPAHQGEINQKSTVSAAESAPETASLKSLKPSQNKELHPLGEKMKGRGQDGLDPDPDPQKITSSRGVRGDEPGFPQGGGALLPMPIEELWQTLQRQIQRLGLTAGQVQQFIADRFGGRRRAQLADEELLLLLYYLQANPPPLGGT